MQANLDPDDRLIKSEPFELRIGSICQLDSTNVTLELTTLQYNYRLESSDRAQNFIGQHADFDLINRTEYFLMHQEEYYYELELEGATS